MDEPRNGRRALNLLLRLSMLRARQRGGGSLAERGYALAVALIAAFVLLLGVGALASRGQLGFIGQVFQAQNRQARDVAEAAIAEFADTMNREENRYLLIANNSGSDWDNPINRNPCLAFNDDQSPIDTRNPDDPTTLPTIGAGVVTRFQQGNTFQNLRPGNDDRQFRVESIQHLNPDRNGPIDRDDLINADDRGLIRVVMIGQVDLGNGRVSQARVAREFEVVPKCCNRSFGANDARNWGRDREACQVTGISQFRVSLSGGNVSGKGGAINVLDENEDRITQAVCWGGSDENDPDNILGQGDIEPNEECIDGLMSISGKDGGTSFAPAEFEFTPPPYASDETNSPPQDYLSLQTIVAPSTQSNEILQEGLNIQPSATLVMPSKNTDYYIYFDDDPAVNNLRVCEVSGSGIDLSTCFDFPNDSNNNPSCYHRIDQNLEPRAPYHEVNCRLRNIETGNQIIYLDTSKARINFFFDNSQYTDELMGGGGNSTFQRVHCRWGSSDYYDIDYDDDIRCNQDLVWRDSVNGNDFQQVCKTSTGQACGLTDSTGSFYSETYFDVSELFNIYSNSPGSFDLNGTAATIGFNLYAPFSDVTIRGGGTADPNFMGRLWTDGLDVRGSVELRVPSGGPSGFDDSLLAALWDFRARSFTQSSGF